MALIIGIPAKKNLSVQAAKKPRRTGHAQALPVFDIDLSQPGRLRVGHMMTLFNVSHSTFYAHIRAGRIPKRDGSDGSRPFWLTGTVVKALGSGSSTIN